MSDHILKALQEQLSAGMREVTKLPGSEAAVEALSKAMLLVVEHCERGIAACAVVGKVMLAGEHPGRRGRGVELRVKTSAGEADLFFPFAASILDKVKQFTGHDVEVAIDVFRPVTAAKVHAAGNVSAEGQKLAGLTAELVETFMRRATRGCIAPDFDDGLHALVLMLPDGTGVALPQTMEEWTGLHRQIGYLLKGKLKVTGPELSS